MRRIALGALAAAAFVALLLPPLDRALVATMPRLLLVQMPALVALGLLAGRQLPPAVPRADPHGLAALAFFVGALGFWMIPRAVDAVAVSPAAATAMRASLFAAGAGLAVALRVMPFALRGALAVYAVAMLLAMGVIYSSYRALLCSTFSLADQALVGSALLHATPLALLAAIGFVAHALHRERTRARPGARPAARA